MQPAKTPVERMTVEDYLRMERASDERHVYLDGRVWAMAGESLSHGRVSVNLVGLFHAQLDGKPCEPLTKDTKVRSGPAGPRPFRTTAGLFSYPDLVVVCGEPEHLDEHQDVITNPVAVVEVLSPSTEAFDRGEKFNRLARWNATLSDYLLVAQTEPWIDHYTRQPDGSWRLDQHHGLDAECAIPSVGVRLPLSRVYARVTFPDPAE